MIIICLFVYCVLFIGLRLSREYTDIKATIKKVIIADERLACIC